jgi:hypothetical protein
MLAQCIIYYFFPLEQGTSYGKGRRRNFKRGSFDWKLRVLVPFLIVERDWRTTSPFPRPSFPQTSNQNFEIAILFSVVDFQIENMFLRRTLPHNSQGKGCKLCPGGI